jgi:hypothetical protein
MVLSVSAHAILIVIVSHDLHIFFFSLVLCSSWTSTPSPTQKALPARYPPSCIAAVHVPFSKMSVRGLPSMSPSLFPHQQEEKVLTRKLTCSVRTIHINCKSQWPKYQQAMKCAHHGRLYCKSKFHLRSKTESMFAVSSLGIAWTLVSLHCLCYPYYLY